jgi:hypothetical protein
MESYNKYVAFIRGITIPEKININSADIETGSYLDFLKSGGAKNKWPAHYSQIMGLIFSYEKPSLNDSDFEEIYSIRDCFIYASSIVVGTKVGYTEDRKQRSSGGASGSFIGPHKDFPDDLMDSNRVQNIIGVTRLLIDIVPGNTKLKWVVERYMSGLHKGTYSSHEGRFATPLSKNLDVLVDYIIVLESLFGDSQPNSITYKIAMKVAFYIGNGYVDKTDKYHRANIFEFIKACYDLRSRFVHGESKIRFMKIFNKVQNLEGTSTGEAGIIHYIIQRLKGYTSSCLLKLINSIHSDRLKISDLHSHIDHIILNEKSWVDFVISEKSSS